MEYNCISCGFPAVNFICEDKFFETFVVVATLCLYGDFPKRESPASGRVVQGVNKVACDGMPLLFRISKEVENSGHCGCAD